MHWVVNFPVFKATTQYGILQKAALCPPNSAVCATVKYTTRRGQINSSTQKKNFATVQT
jgi:hypothetical protein